MTRELILRTFDGVTMTYVGGSGVSRSESPKFILDTELRIAAEALIPDGGSIPTKITIEVKE